VRFYQEEKNACPNDARVNRLSPLAVIYSQFDVLFQIDHDEESTNTAITAYDIMHFFIQYIVRNLKYSFSMPISD